MFQAFSRLFVLIASASIVVGNGTQIIDWHALNDAEPNQDDSQVQLILYSRKWREGTTDMSQLKKKLHTFVLIHGFNDNLKDSIMLPLLAKNYLDREKCNVVVVDWAEFAKGPWFINAAKNTLVVGKQLAAWLDTSGLDMRRVTLVGFSMGAHVAGDAGHFAKKRVSRIVALDPAHFLFQNSPPEFRLDSTDAEIVEVVHTSGGFVGEKESLGTRDFFPNGGTYPQPGCSPDPTGTCSHRRAYYYYSEAISRPDDNFRGRRCTSFDHFVKHKCLEKGKPVILHLVNTNRDKQFTGNFYFMTNSKEPFIRRNTSDNGTSTEKHPSSSGKRTTTEIPQTTVDKHRGTKDKQQLAPTTDKMYLTTSKKMTTTGKRHAYFMDSTKDSSTPTTKHRTTTNKQSTMINKQLTTIGKHQTTVALRQTTPNKHQTSTDKQRMSTEKTRMVMDKYQTTPYRPLTTVGKQHKTTAISISSTKTTTTERSKHRTGTDKQWTTTGKFQANRNKRQVFLNKHSMALVKHRASRMCPGLSSTEKSKNQTTAIKRQTTTGNHTVKPMGGLKYNYYSTSKHKVTKKKSQTNTVQPETTTDKFHPTRVSSSKSTTTTAKDKYWTVISQTPTGKRGNSTKKREKTTEKRQTTTEKRQTTTEKRQTTTEKRQMTTGKRETTTNKRHPALAGSPKYRSFATTKPRTTRSGIFTDKRKAWTIMDVHQTARDQHRVAAPRGYLYYKSLSTSKHRKTERKDRTTSGRNKTSTEISPSTTDIGETAVSKLNSTSTGNGMSTDKNRMSSNLQKMTTNKHQTLPFRHRSTIVKHKETPAVAVTNRPNWVYEYNDD